MFKKLTLLLLLVLGILGAEACIGKTLTIGAVGTLEQRICAEIFKTVIVERTGTTVEVKQFTSYEKINAALLAGEIDLYIAYTGQAIKGLLKQTTSYDDGSYFKQLKQDFSRKLGMVWLSPLGFESQDQLLQALKAEGFRINAAPLLRKETLKQFPALARLLNKMGGKISATELQSLMDQSERQDLDRVARDFLKDKKLI